MFGVGCAEEESNSTQVGVWPVKVGLVQVISLTVCPSPGCGVHARTGSVGSCTEESNVRNVCRA